MIQQPLLEIPALPSNLDCWDKNTNLPRFLINRYEGMESDLADFYLSFYFHREWDGSDNPSSLIHANTEARMEAIIQTGRMYSATEEALVIQLHEAQRTEFLSQYGEGIAEIHGMRELTEMAFAREFEKHPDAGPRYEYATLLRVLNTLEEMMIKKKGSKQNRQEVVRAMRRVIASTQVRSKTRESGKTLEHVLTKDMDDDVKFSVATEILEDIANPKVKAHELREKNQERMGKVGEKITKIIEGGFYIIGGNDLLVIQSPSKAYTRAIESQLKALVSFSIGDPANLLKDISNLLLTRGKFKEYKMEFGNFCRFREREGGIRLPTPDYMAELISNEIMGKIKYIAPLSVYQDIYIPLFPLVESINGDPFEETIKALGAEITEDVEDQQDYIKHRYSEVLVAIRDLYHIPKEVQSLFPYGILQVGLYWDVRAFKSPMCVCVSIEKERRVEVDYETVGIPVEG